MKNATRWRCKLSRNKQSLFCDYFHRQLRHRYCAEKRQRRARALLVSLKSPGLGSTWNRQIRKHPFYSRRNVEPFAKTNGEHRVNHWREDHRDDDRDSLDCAFLICYDERLESDRDAGFTRGRRSLVESANPRQTDCESI